LRFGKFFCYYFTEYIMYPFSLHLFFFFDAHDLQVSSFDGVAEFLCILFAAFESFVLRVLLFVFTLHLFCLQVLRFCLLLVLVCCNGFLL
jgi:hypothetical protein